MSNLESRIDVPFKIGTYYFNLVWNWFKVGEASLSFWNIDADALPSEAKKVYDSGGLYQVVFKGRITAPLVQRIAKEGIFVSYIVVENNDARPLASLGKTSLFGRNSEIISVYDYKNNIVKVNDVSYAVDNEKMQFLRDPVSHVVHLLFRSRKTGGTYSCGYFADEKGVLNELVFDFSVEKETMIGRGSILARTYVLNTSVGLELPYSFDAEKQLFVPSLTERVAISHWLGRIVFEYKKFSP